MQQFYRSNYGYTEHSTGDASGQTAAGWQLAWGNGRADGWAVFKAIIDSLAEHAAPRLIVWTFNCKDVQKYCLKWRALVP